MLDTSELLQKAIQAARDGHELTARDLFQDVVRLDPDNEIAWMWLSGLLDPLEDRIAACGRVLSLNPENHQMRAYLKKLIEEQKVARRERLAAADERVRQVRWLLDDGKREEALQLLQGILREEDGHVEAWGLFANLSVNIHDKVRAYEAIAQIDPSNESARKALKRFQYFQRNPLELADYYEEEGDLDKALELYQILAAEAGDSSEFERIHKHIVRLEDLKIEKIRHVKPAINILRLSVGFPLLYILEILLQEGINPIKHPAPDLWIGIPIVAVGSFFLTVASVRVRHVIWHKWFGEQAGKGSRLARTIVAVAGWTLVLAPHLLLVLDSYLRLLTFQTPYIPWLN